MDSESPVALIVSAIGILVGPGHIIKIDESKFGKRKYNRGRIVVYKWILGGYNRTTNECFLVECTDETTIPSSAW